MGKLSFQYAVGRFCDPNKIVDASIYTKQSKEVDTNGKYPVVTRVALSMDTENKDKATLYSDALKDNEAALGYIASVPTN